MKLGVLSDVHGNFEAFDAAVAAMAPNVDELLVAGDAFSDHRFSNEVIARVRAMGARYVLGNHELSLLGPTGSAARGATWIDRQHLEFVSGQPLQIRLTIGSKTLLMVHGSPWEPYGNYLSQHHPRFHRCDELEADFLITGHTHTAFSRRFGRTLVVNPGSIGKSDDPERRDKVTYAVVDTSSDEVTIHELDNPQLIG